MCKYLPTCSLSKKKSRFVDDETFDLSLLAIMKNAYIAEPVECVLEHDNLHKNNR